LRTTLFQKLYSITNLDPIQVQEENIQSKPLEERLALLESSLPTRLKSEKERYKDLSKGLAKLGVTNHYKDVSSSCLEDVESLDELDEVDQIIQMATDSVTVQGGTTSTSTTNTSVKEVIDIMEMHDLQDENRMSESDSSTHGSISDSPPNLEPSMERVRNLIQSITQRIKEETEPLPVIESTPNSTKEKLKVWINEAQQLLLQASLCLEESDDPDTNKVDEDEVNYHKNDMPLTNPNGMTSESLIEKGIKETVNRETKSIANVQKNPILDIGRTGLLEVQKLVEEILISWPNE
jgi:hypothetical protein